MYSDCEGTFAISALIIGALVGACIGAGMAMYKVYRDDNLINGSIGVWNYVGSILGGAIAGCGQGFVSTVMLGMLGSVTDSVVGSGFNPNWGETVINSLKSAALSAVGFVIRKLIRCTAAGFEAKALKSLAKWKGNNFVNHGLKWMKAGVNIGMKDINKIAKGLFTAERDLLGIGIESIGSSIPDIIKFVFE